MADQCDPVQLVPGVSVTIEFAPVEDIFHSVVIDKTRHDNSMYGPDGEKSDRFQTIFIF
jgi:hypothetical protein